MFSAAFGCKNNSGSSKPIMRPLSSSLLIFSVRCLLKRRRANTAERTSPVPWCNTSVVTLLLIVTSKIGFKDSALVKSVSTLIDALGNTSSTTLFKSFMSCPNAPFSSLGSISLLNFCNSSAAFL